MNFYSYLCVYSKKLKIFYLMSLINALTTNETNLIIGKANSTYSLFEITIENDITIFTKVKPNFARSLEKAREKYPNLTIDNELNGTNVIKRKYDENGTFTDLTEKKKSASGKTRTPKVKATDKDLPLFNKQIAKFNTSTYQFSVVNQPKLMVVVQHARYSEGAENLPIDDKKFAFNVLSPRRINLENYDIDWSKPYFNGQNLENGTLYAELKNVVQGKDTLSVGYPLKVKTTKTR